MVGMGGMAAQMQAAMMAASAGGAARWPGPGCRDGRNGRGRLVRIKAERHAWDGFCKGAGRQRKGDQRGEGRDAV